MFYEPGKQAFNLQERTPLVSNLYLFELGYVKTFSALEINSLSTSNYKFSFSAECQDLIFFADQYIENHDYQICQCR